VSRVNTSTKSYSVYNYYAFNQAYVILGKIWKFKVKPIN
jgi:hypothetical protein